MARTNIDASLAIQRPIVEEALRQIYVERASAAKTMGLGGLDRIYFILIGDSLDSQPEPQADAVGG